MTDLILPENQPKIDSCQIRTDERYSYRRNVWKSPRHAFSLSTLCRMVTIGRDKARRHKRYVGLRIELTEWTEYEVEGNRILV